MLSWICPLCGHETSFADLNLIALFEWYLLLTFAFSLAIRYQLYRSYVELLWSMPDKWPAMYDVIKKHSRTFVRWTTIIPVGITLAIYLLHMLSYRLIWYDAHLSPVDLWQSWIVFLPAFGLSVAMLYFDFRGLFQISRVDFTQVESDLHRGEYALKSRMAKWVRRLTFNRINPQKIVESRVADTMKWVRRAFLTQLRHQSFHTVVRIAFGFLLWASWGRIQMNLPWSLYLIALVTLSALIAFAWRWTRENGTESDSALEEDS